MKVVLRPVCVLIVLGIAFVSFLPLGVRVGRSEMIQRRAPTIIDSAGVSNCQGQFCVHSQSLTTTRGHDVIILVVECGDGTRCNNISSITDSSGLTFTQRISYSNGDRLGTKLWEYYAIATSPLRSDNITVVTDTCKVTVYCIERLQVVAIHGSSTRAIFDTNPSIPATQLCPGVELLSCSASVQTSTVDLVIASTGINDAPPCGPGGPRGVVPGFTNIANQNNRFEIDYAITATPQSTVVFSCNGTDAVAIVIDAISLRGESDVSSNDTQNSD